MLEPPPVRELMMQLKQFADDLQDTLGETAVPWHWRPAEDEWSLTEVICHLRDVELEVHQTRFQAVVTQERAFLPGVSADEWAEPRQYYRQDGPGALRAFLEARQKTVAMLSQLDEAMWQRQGSHAFFGPTTLHELLNLVVGHDQSHWQQVQMLLQESDK
ncbi:MAG: DinB family protein [Ardenticatenaceae bacterium]|nr:DinB family protein [Anaerolineales bacterium]MCB8920404.1 DinB family protein [Ardenticatenaceae bacterium]MCB8989359.1 DinB family protein [Ardenticatenaceae bacterium]MCB9004514.1 DinB family protein [Ardenticatenaceae bacterium]